MDSDHDPTIAYSSRSCSWDRHLLMLVIHWPLFAFRLTCQRNRRSAPLWLAGMLLHHNSGVFMRDSRLTRWWYVPTTEECSYPYQGCVATEEGEIIEKISLIGHNKISKNYCPQSVLFSFWHVFLPQTWYSAHNADNASSWHSQKVRIQSQLVFPRGVESNPDQYLSTLVVWGEAGSCYWPLRIPAVLCLDMPIRKRERDEQWLEQLDSERKHLYCFLFQGLQWQGHECLRFVAMNSALSGDDIACHCFVRKHLTCLQERASYPGGDADS